MATLMELEKNGTLIKFKPLLDPGQLEHRVAYMTKEAWEWCYSSKELGQSKCPNPLAYDSLHAALTDFATGTLLYLDGDIRRLDRKKEKDDIWEIKTRPPDAVRMFGWFYNRNIFVASHCAYKKDIKNYQPHKIKAGDLRVSLNCFYAPNFGRMENANSYFNI